MAAAVMFCLMRQQQKASSKTVKPRKKGGKGKDKGGKHKKLAKVELEPRDASSSDSDDDDEQDFTDDPGSRANSRVAIQGVNRLQC